MKNRIYNYYVCSHHFNGLGRGFALGFDDERAAHIFANYVLFGWASVLADWELEKFFPSYYHQHIAGA